MKITWYGHSCFLLTGKNGIRVLTDPCAPTTGYRLHDISCDVITSSHSHYDHNYFVAASGEPKVLTDGGADLDGMKIESVKTFHDREKGKQRGGNTVFCFDDSDIRVVHMGDFGEEGIRRETLEAIGRVDVLLMPIGGIYTVDAAEALEIADKLNPKILIPMHYKTEALEFELGGIDGFLREADGWNIQRLNGTSCIITGNTLPEQKKVIVFEFETC